jgi:hypothetical protein
MLRIEGYVSDVRDNSALSTVSVELQEQILEGGSFNSSFQDAASGVTNVNGDYALEFLRQNAAEYRLTFERNDYFTKEFSINPDNVDPEEAYTLNAALTPEAYLTVSLTNTNPFDDEDRIVYRNLNTFFSCACCNTSSVVVEGMDADTSFTCRLHGDFTVDYTYEVSRDQSDTTITGSIFCPAFETTVLTIQY